VTNFKKLELEINAHVDVGVTSKTTMQIHAQKNIADIITTEVRGDKLVISSSRCFSNTEAIHIKVFTTELEGIKVEGVGTVRTMNPIIVDEIEFEVEGSGEIFADVYANSVKSEIEGSGEIVVNGTTSSQKVKIEGSGTYQAIGLRANDSKVKIEGSGKAQISSIDILNIVINGSGSLIYSGNPSISSEISGSGTVSKIN
jgi:hypothetical protein